MRAVPKSFRPIRKIDTDEFEQSLWNSELFSSPATTVDGFAEQLERVVVAELDRVAPLKHCRRRPSKPVARWLSQDAINAKRLERQWRRTQLDSDRIAYRQVCRRANKFINGSRHNFYRDQPTTISDPRDRWKLTKNLLHSTDPPLNRTELENTKLCSSFSDYFSNKIIKLKQAVAKDKLFHPTHLSADCPHLGTSFNTLRRVIPTEVLKIIRALPPKSSPLDFIPTSLIKSCSHVFL